MQRSKHMLVCLQKTLSYIIGKRIGRAGLEYKILRRRLKRMKGAPCEVHRTKRDLLIASRARMRARRAPDEKLSQEYLDFTPMH